MKITNDPYLDFIRHKLCLVNNDCEYWRTGAGYVADPHHVEGKGYRSERRNDFHTVPLCRKHHTEIGNSDPAEFAEKYSLDIWKEVSYLRAEFDNREDKRHDD